MRLCFVLPASCLAAMFTVTAAEPAPPKEKPEPEWMGPIRQAYGLKDHEYVKRVTRPWVPERTEFHLRAYGPPKSPEVEEANRAQFQKLEDWMTLVIDQDGTQLAQRFCISSAGRATKPGAQPGENLFGVADAVEYVTGLSAPEFVIDPKHKDHPLFAKDNLTVRGDFVVRKKAPLDKLAAQLGTILRDQCKVEVELRVVEEVQDVFVVAGTFDLKPPPWREKKVLDVYATDDGLNKDYDHFDFAKQRAYTGRVKSLQYSGSPIDYVRFLGERLHVRMTWDGDGPTGAKLSWNNHVIGNPTAREEADDKDPEKVWKHATEQCGLTFKKDRRKVPVLVLSPTEKK
jgi:hypothetical protein